MNLRIVLFKIFGKKKTAPKMGQFSTIRFHYFDESNLVAMSFSLE